MRILYFDCFSGISGDMTLASLVDLGADREYIERELKKLNVDGYTLSWRRVNKSGISALKADVELEPATHSHSHAHEHEHVHHHHHVHDHHVHDHHEHDRHDHTHHHHEHGNGHDHTHDQVHVYGHHHHEHKQEHEHSHDNAHHHEHLHHHDHHHDHEHSHSHSHDHDHHHGHGHEHDHEHEHGHSHHHHHGHDHHHRTYKDIVKLIEDAGLSPRATEIALAVFAKIGAAEAKIHGIPLDTVHFHEVGAVDSIVDIVGVALAIDSLHPDRILSAPVPLGAGTIRIDHGLYPIPAPATLEMMRGLPIAPSTHRLEMTTPTGAGIIAALVDEFNSSLPPMIIESIGYGAGTRDLPNQPNVLRSVLGFAEKRLNIWPSPHVEVSVPSVHDQERHHRDQ